MRNNSLLADFYQLTMMQGYFRADEHRRRAVFEMFIRENPGGNGFTIFAGLEQFAEYIKNLRFDEEDLEYLRTLGVFDADFLEFLKDFKFTGCIYAMAEGSVVFPEEPLVVVKAPIIEAHFIETALLNIINHQSLIATKASRVVHTAGDDEVLEFGARRAQGPDAAVYGARASVIGGASATSNVLAGKMFGLPVCGTHSHSWIMAFDCELTAFRHYAAAMADKCILLVDTYDTLKSGIPNAIRIFDEMLASKPRMDNYGIRLDSGDFAYLSKVARLMLDKAGHPNAKITASGDLDEDLIQSLKFQGARIDSWGVGTRLITSKSAPAMGGVFKLVAVEDDGELKPKIKLSENPEKVTTPGVKMVYRIYDSKSRKMKADLVTLEDEVVDENRPLSLFDPKAPWKQMHLNVGEYYTKELLMPIFKKGEKVYDSPSVMDIKDFCAAEQNTLWEEYRRLVNPQIMPVDLSLKLYELKQQMIYDAKL